MCVCVHLFRRMTRGEQIRRARRWRRGDGRIFVGELVVSRWLLLIIGWCVSIMVNPGDYDEVFIWLIRRVWEEWNVAVVFAS